MPTVALLAAAGCAALAVVVAVPVALGLWFRHAWLGVGLGAILAAMAACGLAVAVGAEPALWVLANAAAGMPVVAVLGLAGLRRITPKSLTIAAVSGLAPAAQVRFLIAPLMLPGVLVGAVAVFLAVFAEVMAG